MNINRLPALTYNHLKMNETNIEWPLADDANIEISGGLDFSKKANLNIATGCCEGADSLFESARVFTLCCPASTSSKVILNCDTTTENAKAVIELVALENSDLTVYMCINPSKSQKSLALRTLIKVNNNARIKLVQIAMTHSEHTLLNDFGCECDANSYFEFAQLFPGVGSVYNGNRIDLIGNNSELKADVAYLAKNNSRVDINYIVNHIGLNTLSNYQADGVLYDNAFKIFRGTIDFKTGSSGSIGHEVENVLLLSDDMVNQTIPLILCAEEDVEGTHGAAIGRLDDDMLFYMASRGIDEDSAERMITQANFNRIIRTIDDENIQNSINNYLEEIL